MQDDLAELAGFYGLTPTLNVEWWCVTELYRAPHWDTCPLAVADVTVAESCGIPVLDLDKL